MQKNKIVLMLVIGIILSPIFVLQAEETPEATNTSTTIQIKTTKEIRQGAKNDIKNLKESVRKEVNDTKKNIIASSKEQSVAVKQDIEKQIEIIKTSTILTAEQKKIEIQKLQEKRIADLKVIIEARQKEIKSNVGAKITALKNNIEARKIDIKKIISEKKDIIKKKLATKNQEKVKAMLEKIYTNLDSRIEKLTSVDIKILAKINDSATKGIDVTVSKAQYTIARTALDKAITDIAATKAVSIDQTKVQTSKEAIRALVKTAEDSIKIAGTEYRKIIPLIIPGESATGVGTEVNSNIINQ